MLLFDLSPAALGAGIGSITGGFMVGSFLAGRLAARVRLSTMMIAGRIVGSVALVFGLAMFWCEFPRPGHGLPSIFRMR